MTCLHHPENEKKARTAFDALDHDKSGGLDHKEFEEFARAVLKVDLESKMDEDEYMIPFAFGLDYGEVVEKVRRHHIESFAERMFKTADKNKDDIISFDEFLGFLKVHSENPYEVSGLNQYRKHRVVKEALHEPDSGRKFVWNFV